MSDEQEREQKQNYLRDSILNAGLDAEKFVQFLESARGIYYRFAYFLQ